MGAMTRPIAMTSLFLEHLQDAVPYRMHSAVISLVHPVKHTPVYLFWGGHALTYSLSIR